MHDSGCGRSPPILDDRPDPCDTAAQPLAPYSYDVTPSSADLEENGTTSWRLTPGLRRWRAAFVLAVLAAAALVVTDLVLARSARLRMAESSMVLRHAATAQALLWKTEAAIRRVALLGDQAPAPEARALREGMLEELATLDRLSATSTEHRGHLDSIRVAVERWDAVVLTPVLAGAPLTRQLALEGTASFDQVALHFDEFIEAQAAHREAALRDLGRIADLGPIVVLTALLVIIAAFHRVSERLVLESEHARTQQAQLAAQATEMEQQALQVEQQATMLEEQTAELEHRIEEQHETNRLLEETGAYLDSAVESAPIGVGFLDRELRFVRVNEALAAINGRSGASHVGRSVDEVAPGVAAAITAVLTRVLRTGVPEADVAIEGSVEAGASPRQWRLTCYPLRSKGRPPIGVGVMVLDVTERTLLEEQLRQSQKMEAVGRLAGGIAHDFNNVLTIIQSYAELLAVELPQGAEGHGELRAIRTAADRAAALARQLLAFSRREVVIPKVLDAHELLRGMHGILERLLRQGIELRMDLDPAPRLIRADAGQIEQVVLNLAINAVHAMRDGGTLTIATREVPSNALPRGTPEQRAFAISVTDTGTGMSVDTQRRLFEPFFTTKPAGEGTGLGLATAYAIVQAADGVIRAESELGKGSRFDVILPLRADADREPDTRPSPHNGMQAARAGETILLVEDEPAIRQALSRVLSGHGYRVIEASNGGEALRVAEETPGEIDLMLTDVMMPGIGGKELVQRLLVTRSSTRVILMSGYTDDELLRQDLGDARYMFLQKPFAARQAVAAVREMLDAD